jgi:hypothetical protein
MLTFRLLPMPLREKWLFTKPAFSLEPIVDETVVAVLDKNVQGIIEMFSPAARARDTFLANEIHELVAALPTEHITFEWDHLPGSTDRKNGFKSIRDMTAVIFLETSQGTYKMFLTYEYVNDFSRDEIGINQLHLIQLREGSNIMVKEFIAGDR